jgi:hypothetical protein
VGDVSASVREPIAGIGALLPAANTGTRPTGVNAILGSMPLPTTNTAHRASSASCNRIKHFWRIAMRWAKTRARPCCRSSPA